MCIGLNTNLNDRYQQEVNVKVVVTSTANLGVSGGSASLTLPQSTLGRKAKQASPTSIEQQSKRVNGQNAD